MLTRSTAVLLLIICATFAHASTTSNDDSCDIGPYPAATLLLPYFEIETASRSVDTLFTVTNVGYLPQIAHVTIWTDWSYPVLTFNLFLTGYDVQAISLYDVIVNGIVAPPNPILTPLPGGGTSSNTTPGQVSASNGRNPNLVITDCGTLPGILSQTARAAVMSALINGIYTAPGFDGGCGATHVGSTESSHRTKTTAVGYVTIDVTSRCSPTLPTDVSYYTNEILFDNILIGDYQQIDARPSSNYAGDQMVHIRAVPEGGPAGSLVSTNLPYTFYGRFVNKQIATSHYDRRQPLGSTFAARFFQGWPGFNTDLKIWREGTSGPVTCANAISNSGLNIPEIIRFDEHENMMNFCSGQLSIIGDCLSVSLPATSRTSTAGATYPLLNSPAADYGGWLYLKLDSGKADQTVNSAVHFGFPARPSQNWVTVSMSGGAGDAGLFAVDFTALSLGNGCSPAPSRSTANAGAIPIGPAGGILVCPPGLTTCLPGQGMYTGTNVNP
jgi:hypothetical protein